MYRREALTVAVWVAVVARGTLVASQAREAGQAVALARVVARIAQGALAVAFTGCTNKARTTAGTLSRGLATV